MQPRSEVRPPFEPWRHRYALLVAIATLVLLLAGGLVTSTGSGLAVPDWPLSFGRFFPTMTGGVLFEHGHRLVAASVGLLTVVLALWFRARESRPWVRRLAYAAVGTVIAQGLLGGLTVLLRLPPSVSVLHACLAQGFFCMVVLLALATSRSFQAPHAGPAETTVAPGLWKLGALATGLVYLQLILGAVMRHTGAGLAIPDVPLAFGRLVPPLASFEVAIHFAHRVGALLVAVAILALAGRVLGLRPRVAGLTAPAVLLVGMVLAQIALGAGTVVSRLAVLPATVPVRLGAPLLATCLVVTVRAARARGDVPQAARSRAALHTGRAATAAGPAGSIS